MIAWSSNKLKFTLGIGALCVAALMAELSHQAMPICLMLGITMLPLVIFIFIRPDEMRPSIVRPFQAFASIWYLLTVAVLTVLFFAQGERPRGWPMFFIGAAIGCIPCIIVLRDFVRTPRAQSFHHADEPTACDRHERGKAFEMPSGHDSAPGMVPTPARLEIRVSKRRILGLLGLTCLLVASAYFCTTLPDITSRVVGWAGVCFFSLGFVVFPAQLFKVRPQVVIGERGLDDRRSRLGVVEWADVASLYVGEINGQKFLCLDVLDTQKYLSRFSNAGRIAAQANRALGFSALTIGFSGLTHTTDDVLKFVREHHAEAIPAPGTVSAANDERPT